MSKSFLQQITVFCLCLVIFGSCAPRKKLSLFNAPTDVVTDTIKQVYVVNDAGKVDLYYTIKPNDEIAIKNVQNKEFGANTAEGNTSSSSTVASFKVDLDGFLNLPAIGKVQVGGLTKNEATLKIQNLYAQKLLNDPIITLNIINLKVTLLGEFNKQGNFLLERENTNLIDILGEAGGITKTADPKTLKIIRGDKANPEIIYVNLNDVNSLASKKLILQNNDIIYIQSTKGAALSERLQSFNSIIQPLLVIVNLAVLIFTLSK